MQFREFGEWIARLTHGDTHYVIVTDSTTSHPIALSIREAGVQDRFELHVSATVPRGRMYLLAEPNEGDALFDALPLIEALQAAARAGLKGQLAKERILDAAADAMDRNEPFSLAMDDDEPEDLSATQPDPPVDPLTVELDSLEQLRQDFIQAAEPMIAWFRSQIEGRKPQ